MGRATIVSNLEQGKYSIKVDCGTALRDRVTDRLDAQVAELVPQMAEAQTKLDEALAKEQVATAEADAAGNAWAAALQAEPKPKPDDPAVADLKKKAAEALKVRLKAGTEAARCRAHLADLKAQKLEKEKVRDRYAAVDTEETLAEVWCVDDTPDLSDGATVGTIEVPGEPDQVLIAPGGEAGDQYGTVVARELMDPGQLFFCASILPGWQKWMPTYRTGKIVAMYDGKATVELDAAHSSAQASGQLSVNWAQTLTDVGFEYMECNDEPFEKGDAVVVRFDEQDQKKPVVVGFVDNPKPCSPFTVVAVRPNTINHAVYEGLMFKVDPGHEAAFGKFGAVDCVVEWRVGGKAAPWTALQKNYSFYGFMFGNQTSPEKACLHVFTSLAGTTGFWNGAHPNAIICGTAAQPGYDQYNYAFEALGSPLEYRARTGAGTFFYTAIRADASMMSTASTATTSKVKMDTTIFPAPLFSNGVGQVVERVKFSEL